MQMKTSGMKTRFSINNKNLRRVTALRRFNTHNNMKKIYFYILSTLFLISSSCLAQYYSGRHDSLLFDGANETSTNFQKTDEDCLMKVVTVNGNVIGLAMTMVAVVDCGGKVIDSVKLPRKRLLKLGDMVVAGEPISTEDTRDFVILQLADGENLFAGGKRGLVGVRDYCRFPPNIWITLEAGKLGIKWNPLLPKSVTLCTGGLGSCVKITGTQLSLEIVQEGDVTTDILKVYEGSATFGKNMQNQDTSKGEQMKKLAEDYQSGKISIEEFTKKMQEFQKEMTEFLSGNEITVNAGFESRITGTDKPTDPVPIDANEKPWWEDPDFK